MQLSRGLAGLARKTGAILRDTRPARSLSSCDLYEMATAARADGAHSGWQGVPGGYDHRRRPARTACIGRPHEVGARFECVGARAAIVVRLCPRAIRRAAVAWTRLAGAIKARPGERPNSFEAWGQDDSCPPRGVVTSHREDVKIGYEVPSAQFPRRDIRRQHLRNS